VATGRSTKQLEEDFEGKGYAELKKAVTGALIDFLTPIQDRYAELLSDPGEILRLLETGAGKAQRVARQTMESVYERVGFLRRS